MDKKYEHIKKNFSGHDGDYSFDRLFGIQTG